MPFRSVRRRPRAAALPGCAPLPQPAARRRRSTAWRAALLALGVAATAAAAAQTVRYKVLHTFGGMGPDASHPLDAPTVGPDRALYGTAAAGPGFGNGAGALWRLGHDGSYAVLHEFIPDASGGGGPRGPLALGPDGWLYGTASGAGVACGSVFRVDPYGRFEVLHRFRRDEMCAPQGGVAFGPDGALYGTAGVSRGLPLDEGGGVFRLAPDGRLQVLHTFAKAQGGNGAGPNAGVVFGADGALYGTTVNDGPHGAGTLFRLTLDGGFSIVHAFRADTEGRPLQETGARLLLASDGAIYGTLGLEGPSDCGSAFRLDAGGGFALLHVFTDADDVGCAPSGGLIEAADGTFYGTAQFGGPGGALGEGTVFRIDVEGKVALVHAFDRQRQGATPMGGVTLASSGELVGTTRDGGNAPGARGGGVVWRLVERR
jgi:uncharacterized repeat protein (TIGR03803 family)